MDPQRKARLEARANVVKALAHATRLAVVEQLAAGPRCVSDLQALVDCDLSTMSKHLSILKSVGIVQTEKRGTQVFYQLAHQCSGQFFECIDRMIEEETERRHRLRC